MVCFQFLSLAKICLGRSLIIQHEIVEIANLLPGLYNGTFKRSERVVKGMWTILWAELDETAFSRPARP